MTVWAWVWIGWIAYFAGFETWALIRKGQGDTLSENVRSLFRTNTTAGRWVWIVVGGVLFAWLLVHMAVAGALG